MLNQKYERKIELKDKELEIKKMEIELQKRKFEEESEERKFDLKWKWMKENSNCEIRCKTKK